MPEGYQFVFPFNSTRGRAVHEILLERQRQYKLKAEGRFEYMLSDDGPSDFWRLATIMEELGEIAKLLQERDQLVHDGTGSLLGAEGALDKELSQVAALAMAWKERL